MAVLRCWVATASLLGHRTHTEEIILQTKSQTSGAITSQEYPRITTTLRRLTHHYEDEAGMASSGDKYRAEATV